VAKPAWTQKAFPIAALALGTPCLVVAGLGLWNYKDATSHSPSMPDTKILNATITTTDEKNPGKVSDHYKMPANQPRAIDIPSLNASGYVQRVGVSTDNTMIAPGNIFFAGWYVGSPAPGEKGVSIIDGHVRGKYQDGIFRHLASLKGGDTIRVQMGDNSWREFSVVGTQSYLVEEADKALFADDQAIDRELHLITCDGAFDNGSQAYNKRLIVTARLTR